jgi:hypothetical protein
MDRARLRDASGLWRAAERLGSRARLASFLGVDADQLERWLSGAEAAPLWVYLTAFDLIAETPPERRRARPEGEASVPS